MPGDTDELAMPLKGFQKKLMGMDFRQAMENTGVTGKVIDRMFKRFISMSEKWNSFIDISFISPEQKVQYKEIIRKHLETLASSDFKP